MDVLPGNIDKEQDLKSWLEQLHQNGKRDEKHGDNSRQSSDVKTNSTFEFDTILGELADLEKQFETHYEPFKPQPISTTIPTPTNLPPDAQQPPMTSKPSKANVSQALEEFSLVSSRLEDVLNDFAGLVENPPEPTHAPPPVKETPPRVKPPPPPVPSKNCSQATKISNFTGDDVGQSRSRQSDKEFMLSPHNMGNGTFVTPDFKTSTNSTTPNATTFNTLTLNTSTFNTSAPNTTFNTTPNITFNSTTPNTKTFNTSAPNTTTFNTSAPNTTTFNTTTPNTTTDMESANKLQRQQERRDDSPVIQSCVSIELADSSMIGLCVTNKTKIRDLCATILNDFIKSNQKHFTLWEVLPDLSIERELEPDHLVLKDVLNHWSKNSNNKILMKFTKLSVSPQPQLKGELKGTLHVKMEDKKSWKSYTFVMQSTGMFFSPKGKGKSDSVCYLDLSQPNFLGVFFGIGWKKKLKAPTDFGFSIKPLKVQTEPDKEIKYLCADTEALREIWTSAIREKTKTQTSQDSLRPDIRTDPPISTFNDDFNHYSEPYETYQRLQNRRISNASSCSGRLDLEENVFSPSAKKFANLPITTETTRYLQSMQTTVPHRLSIKSPNIEDYNRSSMQKEQLLMEKNQRNQTCLNEYTPSPCKTPELLPKSQSKTNIIKTLPKPNKAICQQTSVLPPDLDLPPPPPSFMTSQYQTLPNPSKSRTLPPPPPKRDQSTKLSMKHVDDRSASIQTRNFILNLDRTIGQKRMFGAEGLRRMEMPLPPPPVVSEETSYLDLGELPPPPAELLQGLKSMRTNPALFQSHRRWP